jgi:predicted RNA-binding protein with PUA domain
VHTLVLDDAVLCGSDDLKGIRITVGQPAAVRQRSHNAVELIRQVS